MKSTFLWYGNDLIEKIENVIAILAGIALLSGLAYVYMNIF